MPINIKDDVVYVLLDKIADANHEQKAPEIQFTSADFSGLELTPAELLGHLDYLNQEGYIKAEFTGNAYGNQEDVPDFANPTEVDFRIANTYAAPDGPLPHLITFHTAELTQKGQQMLEDMKVHPPQSLEAGPRVPIPDKDMPFLTKVMVRGELPDLYDARDITEVVFRVMRDVMSTEVIERVADELHETVLPTDEKALQLEITDLWEDTNPLVRFLSHIRPPLKGPGLSGINDERFLLRISTEAGLPATTNAETVIKAVFSATKDELSSERVQEIADWLPGQIRDFWQHT